MNLDGLNTPQISDDTFEIEKVVDAKRSSANEWMYLVKWKYYNDYSNSWEGEDNFNDKESIEDFWKTHNKQEYSLSIRNELLPTDTSQLDSPKIANIFARCYPKITNEKEIDAILGVKRENGNIIALVKTTLYPTPVRIPTSMLRQIAPKKLVEYYERKIR